MVLITIDLLKYNWYNSKYIYTIVFCKQKSDVS